MNVKVTRESLEDVAKKAVNLDKLNKLINEIIELLLAKNHDYSDAWQRYGIFTPLIRINDKTLRVKTLSGGQQALVADEKIDDTLRDIIGYALLALLWLDRNNPHAEKLADKFEELFSALDEMAGDTAEVDGFPTKLHFVEGEGFIPLQSFEGDE